MGIKFIALFVLVIVLYVLLAVYFYSYVGRVLQRFAIEKGTKKYRIIAISITAICVISGAMIFTDLAVIMLYLFFSCILVDAIGMIVKKLNHNDVPKVWKKIELKGLLPIVFMAVILCGGYWNMNHIRHTTYEVEAKKQVEPLNCVQISDLHLGVNMKTKELEKRLDTISKQKPDLVVLTGDIFDESTPKSEMKKACALFGQMKTRYGVFYIYGNHDSNDYNRNRTYNGADIEQEFKKSQVQVLKDESVLINNQYYIIGRKDASMDRKSIKELVKGLNQEKYMILLDHQPNDFVQEAEANVDLVLCGHSHNGQIWPAALVGGLFHFNDRNYGLEKRENTFFEVSSGMAGWQYKIRTEGISEYVTLKIK